MSLIQQLLALLFLFGAILLILNNTDIEVNDNLRQLLAINALLIFGLFLLLLFYRVITVVL